MKKVRIRQVARGSDSEPTRSRRNYILLMTLAPVYFYFYTAAA